MTSHVSESENRSLQASHPAGEIRPVDRADQPTTLPPPPPSRFTIVRIALGLVLLVAAAFKAYALSTGPIPPTSLFDSPRWQVALIELEALLGLWLLTGFYPQGAWLAAGVGFSLLAGMSLYLGIIGRPSCGCFGRVAINPWYAFSLDLAALMGLWGCRPRPVSLWPWPYDLWARSLRQAACVVAGAAVLLAGCLAAIWLLDPSVPDALATLRGESLSVEEAIIDIGSRPRGERGEFVLGIRNHTEQPIAVLGGRLGCSAIETEDLPLTVPARETRSVRCKFRFLGPPGPFQYAVTLYREGEAEPVVIAWVAGNLLEPTTR